MKFWGTEQAVKYLGCSKTQLKKLANRGEVPAHQLGKDWKFSSIVLFELISKKELNNNKGEKI